jgi:hypothetical protein
MGSNKARAHEETPSPIKQRKGVDEVVGSPMKTPTTLQKQKGNEKVLEPIVEPNEHVDLHFLELSGDMNSLIAPLRVPRPKGGKRMFKHPIVDESSKKQEEEAPRVGRSSKKFLVETFCVFVVQQGEAITKN